MPLGIPMKVEEIASCAPPSLFLVTVAQSKKQKNRSAPAKTGALSNEWQIIQVTWNYSAARRT
jgi:hypothetical protein